LVWEFETGTFGWWGHGSFGVVVFFVRVFPVEEIFFFFEWFFGRTLLCGFRLYGSVKVFETIVLEGWRGR
jgi:hypothetical protein